MSNGEKSSRNLLNQGVVAHKHDQKRQERIHEGIDPTVVFSIEERVKARLSLTFAVNDGVNKSGRRNSSRRRLISTRDFGGGNSKFMIQSVIDCGVRIIDRFDVDEKVQVERKEDDKQDAGEASRHGLVAPDLGEGVVGDDEDEAVERGGGQHPRGELSKEEKREDVELAGERASHVNAEFVDHEVAE